VSRQPGQTIYLMAFGLAVLLGAAGLAVDTGYSYYYATEADTAALAAANGGAELLPDFPAAQNRAFDLVAANGMDPRLATVAIDPADDSRLVVTVRKTFPVLLIKLLGAGPTSTVSRTAESGSPLTGAVAPAGSPAPVAPSASPSPITPPPSPSPVAPTQFDVNIPSQWCGFDGSQLCKKIFSTTITGGGALKLQYIASPAHCSDGRAYFTVDGANQVITDFVGGGQATVVEDYGAVSAGSHVVTVQFEGRVSGCNTVGPGAWMGTLRVFRG
jgi:hypothetical protein